MKAIGIIAEYNPFHNGHLYQIERIKENGMDPKDAMDKATGTYGRFEEGVTFIDPRKQ